MEKFNQIVKKSLKWLAIVGALLVLATIISVLYDNWKFSVDEEIAFKCQLDLSNKDVSNPDAVVHLRFILQSTPQSRARKNYWDGGLLMRKDLTSENEAKRYQYFLKLELEKVDVDNLYLRAVRGDKIQLKVNRETFETTLTDSGVVFNTKGCVVVDPQEYRDEVSDSQEKLESLNKL